MMYRSGWATKEGQERVLGIKLKTSFFEWLLSQAVPSTMDPRAFQSEEDWHRAVRDSLVRLQWDPDRGPGGERLERQAIQLGLKGEALHRYGKQEILEILDLTPFVVKQRERKASGNILLTPIEQVFIPSDDDVCFRIHLSQYQRDR